MGKVSLSRRIVNDTLYTAVCRAIHYHGFPFRKLAAKMKPLVEQHGARKVSEVLFELVTYEGWRTMLNPQARKACRGLLGPLPDKGKAPPPQPDSFLDLLVPLVYTELEEKLKDARRRKATDELQAIESEMVRRGIDLLPEEPEALPLPPPEPAAQDTQPDAESQEEESVSAAMAGISSEGYAAEAKKRSKRQLLCTLRDARKKLAHHGNRSFMGKEARKEIEAAEAELRNRGIEVPQEGEETAQWYKKKE